MFMSFRMKLMQVLMWFGRAGQRLYVAAYNKHGHYALRRRHAILATANYKRALKVSITRISAGWTQRSAGQSRKTRRSNRNTCVGSKTISYRPAQKGMNRTHDTA